MPATLEIIGAYDRRTSVGNMTAFNAHQMVKASSLTVPKSRRPKAHSINEIRDRAVMMGVKFELEGKSIYLTPPNTSEYHHTSKANAWAALDLISAELTKAMSNEEVAAKSVEYKSDF